MNPRQRTIPENTQQLLPKMNQKANESKQWVIIRLFSKRRVLSFESFDSKLRMNFPFKTLNEFSIYWFVFTVMSLIQPSRSEIKGTRLKWNPKWRPWRKYYGSVCHLSRFTEVKSIGFSITTWVFLLIDFLNKPIITTELSYQKHYHFILYVIWFCSIITHSP